MDLLQNIRGLFEAVHFIDGAQLPRPDCWSTQPHQADTVSWEYIGSKTCDKPCHLPSSAGNTVTMELATVNDENPCGDRGLDAVCPPVAIDGTDGEKWRRRESNPQVHSRNSQVAHTPTSCSMFHKRSATRCLPLAKVPCRATIPGALVFRSSGMPRYAWARSSLSTA